MNFFNTVPKSQSKLIVILPGLLVLFYPFMLMALFQSGQFLGNADHITQKIGGAIAVTITLLLNFTVPLLGLMLANRLGNLEQPTPSQIRVRRLAHLMFASPPLYTAIGVALFVLFQDSNHDYLIWGVIWLPILLLTFRSNLGVKAHISPNLTFNWQRLGVFRAIHGITALLILLIYLVPHITNHLSALWNLDVNLWVMEILRQWYRANFVEPVVIILFYCQIFTGLTLWRSRTAHQSDIFGTLQTASGTYLSIFIFSHTIAVFLLARANGVDTTFRWAAGEPTGLLGDGWSVRLIPHYFFAVWMLFTHLACGLRFRLLDHQISSTKTNTITWGTISTGCVISLLIILAMFGVHIS